MRHATFLIALLALASPVLAQNGSDGSGSNVDSGIYGTEFRLAITAIAFVAFVVTFVVLARRRRN